jgi:hypothetical protein
VTVKKVGHVAVAVVTLRAVMNMVQFSLGSCVM